MQLQVTCSSLGIGLLKRKRSNNCGCPVADVFNSGNYGAYSDSVYTRSGATCVQKYKRFP